MIFCQHKGCTTRVWEPNIYCDDHDSTSMLPKASSLEYIPRYHDILTLDDGRVVMVVNSNGRSNWFHAQLVREIESGPAPTAGLADWRKYEVTSEAMICRFSIAGDGGSA